MMKLCDACGNYLGLGLEDQKHSRHNLRRVFGLPQRLLSLDLAVELLKHTGINNCSIDLVVNK